MTAHAAVHTAARLTARSRAAAAAASLGLALAAWGWQPADLAAQSAPAKKAPVKKSAAATKPGKPAAVPPYRGGQGIVVIVNDDAITAYEIEQRAHLLALGANLGEQAKANFKRLVESDELKGKLQRLQEDVVRSNPGKSREELIAIIQERQKQIGATLQKQAIESARAAVMPKLRQAAREELIDDRLKLQAAKKLGIEVSDEDAKALVKALAERNKLSYDGFAQHLKGMGVDISTMLERYRVQKAWRDFVGRRWGSQVTVSRRDVDELLSAAAAEAGQDTVELQLQKLTLAVPGKADQASLTKRFAEAEALRRRFAGCKSMAELAKAAPDARLQDLKFVKPSTVGEPTRALLLAAKDDEVLPPVAGGGGVEIYAVCGRRSPTGNEALRGQAMAKLQSEQLEKLGLRQLRNLRLEADIHYK